ncbi:hypothetical protein AB0J38_45610 [Streptomyces sp. NPDC050095]|uniref:hypothetical protein n=1 Tax=unclassified Streptomyces TaxID=2593676 RepID=UPI003423EE81
MDAEDGGADSAPMLPCRSAPRSPEYVDYHVRFLPLGFVCEAEGGGEDVADTVPPYVNPAPAGLGLVTVCLGAGALVEHEPERARSGGGP